ncbi:hypothetical protein LU699_16465 [Luteimonas fraxinea]|uniref:Uncharacterized protein n=1 Tax=Luteimonas fraxinea TaxID=2901869 RepID=A0ABS8UCM8_9GAMM|nr:hypothetical protein [Luteimonas fraxinea]MCD9096824.1 hypothetical protein [Luteimonas fraxinea]UHH09828.1 hypothetical protein LU699_16465 [Luteimonas fraxinea]
MDHDAFLPDTTLVPDGPVDVWTPSRGGATTLLVSSASGMALAPRT